MVTVPMTFRKAIRGEVARRAGEYGQLRITVSRSVGTGGPSSRLVAHGYNGGRIVRSGQVEQAVILPRRTSRWLSAMSPGRRASRVSATVSHFVDVDGGGPEHVKSSASTVSSSRARAQGQGLNLTVVNGTGEGINLVTQPIQCMYYNGADGSSFSALNTTAPDGYTIEQYLEADGSVGDDPQYQGSDSVAWLEQLMQSYARPVGEDFLGYALASQYGEEAAALLEFTAFGPTDLVAGAIEATVDVLEDGCDAQPSLFTLSANDWNGNVTTQSYVLTEQSFSEHQDGQAGSPAVLLDGRTALDALTSGGGEQEWWNSSATSVMELVVNGNQSTNSPSYANGTGDNGLLIAGNPPIQSQSVQFTIQYGPGTSQGWPFAGGGPVASTFSPNPIVSEGPQTAVLQPEPPCTGLTGMALDWCQLNQGIMAPLTSPTSPFSDTNPANQPPGGQAPAVTWGNPLTSGGGGAI